MTPPCSYDLTTQEEAALVADLQTHLSASAQERVAQTQACLADFHKQIAERIAQRRKAGSCAPRSP